ncbi:hypothetical protein ACFZNM_31890 (plasmid) [Pseudomonas aeruginosa]
MNIEVTGSNNIVAGRDFIENHLKLGNEEIRTLAAILAEEINSRPNETWSPLYLRTLMIAKLEKSRRVMLGLF